MIVEHNGAKFVTGGGVVLTTVDLLVLRSFWGLSVHMFQNGL